MECTRYQTDGMRFLDDELSYEERAQYQAHVLECETCRRELDALGRVVNLTGQLRLRVSDDAFWKDYWKSIARRTERQIGFLLLTGGIVAILLWLVVRVVRSPEFWSYEGVSIAVILLGLIVLFVSVARERYHEAKHDPYKEVER
jgi:hypothetical protein